MTPDEPNRGLERVEFQLRADGIRHHGPTPLRSGIHSRGYLPHVKRENASYFITFRLADSLPKEVLLTFEREYAEAMRRLSANVHHPSEEEPRRELRRKVERYLDRGVGECYLTQP